MSAFLIDQRDYATFAEFIKILLKTKQHTEWYIWEVDEKAKQLFSVNQAAVDYRYGGDEEAEEWNGLSETQLKEVHKAYRDRWWKNKPLLLSKLNSFLDSAVYQCSEGDDCTRETELIASFFRKCLCMIAFDKTADWGELDIESIEII